MQPACLLACSPVVWFLGLSGHHTPACVLVSAVAPWGPDRVPLPKVSGHLGTRQRFCLLLASRANRAYPCSWALVDGRHQGQQCQEPLLSTTGHSHEHRGRYPRQKCPLSLHLSASKQLRRTLLKPSLYIGWVYTQWNTQKCCDCVNVISSVLS